VVDLNTEIFFGNNNAAKTKGRFVAQRDMSGYDMENPAGTIRAFYIANFSEDTDINHKENTVIEPSGIAHPIRMNIGKDFYINEAKIVKIEGISKYRRNHLQKKLNPAR